VNFHLLFLQSVKDLFRLSYLYNHDFSRQNHYTQAIKWIFRAQDATKDGGISAYYSLTDGWAPSYPEVTGYTIPTLYNYQKHTADPEVPYRLAKIGSWLLKIQHPSGAFQSGIVTDRFEPSVFNTAQVLQGLLLLFEKTGADDYLEAARLAARWLCRTQNDDGSYDRFVYLGAPRVYLARVAYPLLQYFSYTKDAEVLEKALKSLRWCILRQKSNGWFKECDLMPDYDAKPISHTIAYTCEGLLHSGILIKDEKLIERAYLTSKALLERFRTDKKLYARYDDRWRPQTGEICLSGCAQFACIWLTFYQMYGDKLYLQAASEINTFLMSTQTLDGDDNICGAIKGSHPIYGSYQRFRYLSWATKFFADALSLEIEICEKK